MSLSETLLAELTLEFNALEREKQNIDERLHAITVLLRPGPYQRNAGTPQETAPMIQGSGLRDALRNVLKSGAKVPADVIQALRETGFELSGKTPIQTRVYNELGRMKKDNIVTRDADGRYSLVA